jgi:hypothetical protein
LKATLNVTKARSLSESKELLAAFAEFKFEL